MRSTVVVDLVLNELKSRQTHSIIRLMVGARRRREYHGRRAKIAKRFEPRLEDRNDRRIVLGINTADGARPVVHVEIARQLLPLGREVLSRRIDGTEMLAHVRGRADEPLLLASPQTDADGALHGKI